MGDKIAKTGTLPKELEDLREKKRKRDEKSKKGSVVKKSKQDVRKGDTVLSADVTEMQVYRPRTRATESIYEQLLALLQEILGDQTPDVLRTAADECLSSIKTENVTDAVRKKNVEEVVGKISEDIFGQMYRLDKN